MAYYEQPGRTVITDRDGKQILTVTYIGDQEAPAPNDVLGTQKSRSVTQDVAGQVRTTYQFELDDPLNPLRPAAGATIEYINSVRTVPMEAHPNFREPFLLIKDVKFIKDKLNEIQSENAFPDLSSTKDPARAASLFGYLAKGITSYYEPSLVIRKTYTAAAPPTARRIGKIASPGVPVPGAPQGANFLLLSVNARGLPGNYQVTEEYEMSGPGGWDTFLYG